VARASDLERRLGVKFKNRALLQQALVHSSFVNENPQIAPESNERLEFLGDAVLGLVVADDLYAAYPERDEGHLTELRTHLVRRDTLAKAARRLKLGEDLKLGRGEDGGGGRTRASNLSHAYESMVGAIFLDGGLKAARKFVRMSLRPEIEAMTERAFPVDPKSRLQELSQSRYQMAPHYRLVQAEGPDHARHFTIEVLLNGKVSGTGSGRSKQDAEKEAANEALANLDGVSPDAEAGMSSGCT
jgi:ribonuclease-3